MKELITSIHLPISQKLKAKSQAALLGISFKTYVAIALEVVNGGNVEIEKTPGGVSWRIKSMEEM